MKFSAKLQNVYNECIHNMCQSHTFITSILDNSIPDNVCLMTTVSANAGSAVPLSEAERKGVEVRVVDGRVAGSQHFLFINHLNFYFLKLYLFIL